MIKTACLSCMYTFFLKLQKTEQISTKLNNCCNANALLKEKLQLQELGK